MDAAGDEAYKAVEYELGTAAGASERYSGLLVAGGNCFDTRE